MLVPVEMQIRASIRQAEVLADYIRDRTVAEMDNTELFFLTTHIGYRPYSWNRAAMEQLKTASALRRMNNKHLARRICRQIEGADNISAGRACVRKYPRDIMRHRNVGVDASSKTAAEEPTREGAGQG